MLHFWSNSSLNLLNQAKKVPLARVFSVFLNLLAALRCLVSVYSDNHVPVCLKRTIWNIPLYLISDSLILRKCFAFKTSICNLRNTNWFIWLSHPQWLLINHWSQNYLHSLFWSVTHMTHTCQETEWRYFYRHFSVHFSVHYPPSSLARLQTKTFITSQLT